MDSIVIQTCNEEGKNLQKFCFNYWKLNMFLCFQSIHILPSWRMCIWQQCPFYYHYYKPNNYNFKDSFIKLNTLYLPAGSWAISISSSHMSTLLQSIVLNILKEIVICFHHSDAVLWSFVHTIQACVNFWLSAHGIVLEQKKTSTWNTYQETVTKCLKQGCMLTWMK